MVTPNELLSCREEEKNSSFGKSHHHKARPNGSYEDKINDKSEGITAACTTALLRRVIVIIHLCISATLYQPN